MNNNFQKIIYNKFLMFKKYYQKGGVRVVAKNDVMEV